MTSKNEAVRELKAKQVEMLEMGYCIGPLEFKKHKAYFRHRTKNSVIWVTYQKSFDPPMPEVKERTTEKLILLNIELTKEVKMLRDDKMSLQSKNDELEKTIKKISEVLI